MKLDPKYSALFTTVNLLLGVGPLIIPTPFYKAGILLSSLWMVIIAFLSYNAAMYIAQAMSKVAYLDQSTTRILQSSLISEQYTQNTNQTATHAVQQTSQDTVKDQKKKTYDHIEQFGVLFGQKFKIIPSLAISIYLTGTAISKCIMTGNILSRVFEGTPVIEQYRFWLGLFFLSGAAFSFSTIQKTKVMQAIIIIVRFVSIFLMIFGALFLIIKNGIKPLTPPDEGIFNINNFTQIFSNTVFSFMFHHSLPGISAQTKNTADTTFFIRYGFLIASSTLFVIPLTAVMAFGQQLGQHTYIYYNFDFYDHSQVKFIYYVVSFYVFLNIAAFSVYVIVVRTNILKIMKPQVNPMKPSKITLFSTLILLTVILAVSLLLQEYIQYVLDFTGGIFGTMILFIIPCVQVYNARKKVHRKGQVKNYIQKLPLLIFGLGILFMGFNLYQVIKKL